MKIEVSLLYPSQPICVLQLSCDCFATALLSVLKMVQSSMVITLVCSLLQSGGGMLMCLCEARRLYPSTSNCLFLFALELNKFCLRQYKRLVIAYAFTIRSHLKGYF